MAYAHFAMGCFWKPEAVFRQVRGVLDATVGYSGGHTENPSYRDVCGGDTGHAETVMVEYDPEQISYEGLLEVFWKNHDPTTPNRQGPDVGSQYRSAIFAMDDAQLKAAQASRDALVDSDRVVTQIEPSGEFYKAEEYHQQYLARQGRVG